MKSEWFETFMAVTGLSTLSWKIEEERLKRNDELYQNPYMEVEEIVISLYFEMFIGLRFICQVTWKE